MKGAAEEEHVHRKRSLRLSSDNNGEGSGKGGRGMPEATKSLARNGRQDGGQPLEE